MLIKDIYSKSPSKNFLSLKEKDLIEDLLWKARLKNETITSDSLLRIIISKRNRPINRVQQKFILEYIKKERNRIVQKFYKWKKETLPPLIKKFPFLSEELLCRWEYLGILSKISKDDWILTFGEFLYFSAYNNSDAQKIIHFNKTPLWYKN